MSKAAELRGVIDQQFRSGSSCVNWSLGQKFNCKFKLPVSPSLCYWLSFAWVTSSPRYSLIRVYGRAFMWKNRLTSLIPNGNPKLFLLLAAIAAFSAASFATTVSVTTTTYQSQYGVSYNVTGAFTATDQGFSVEPNAIGASTQPCTWANNGVCNTALTTGHYKYTLTLTVVTPPGSTNTYTVTVKWDQGSGQTTLGTLTVTAGTTAAAGQVMTFKFDTGGTSFTTPLSLDVTVA